AVIYLNGAEVARPGMAGGAVAYTTSSSRGDEISAHGVDVVTFTPTNLISGQNVIAVEVHQTGTGGVTTSSDLIWAMSLTATVAVPVAIVTPPASQTIPLGSPVTFSVGITGGPARYQWQKNNANISNQTNSTYSIGTVVA